MLDADGDGALDLLLGSRSGAVALFRNRGALRFEEAEGAAGLPADAAVTALASADLDGDGDEDVVVADRDRWRAYANAGGSFTLAAEWTIAGATEYILPFDVDGDGRLDLFGGLGRGGGSDGQDRLLRNAGALRFEDASALLPSSPSKTWTATSADLDGDGASDLYVANDTLTADFGDRTTPGLDLPVDALLSGPTLTDRAPEVGLAAPRSSMGGIPADLDDDGDLDLLIPDYGANKAMAWDGDGFTDVAPTLGLDPALRAGPGCDLRDLLADERCLLMSWGAAVEDLDLDGRAEVVVANGMVDPGDLPPPILLFTRDGDAYREMDTGLGCFDGQAMAAADLDRDGDLDLVLTAREGPVLLVENTSAGSGGWMRVRLTGRQSNREGRGSQVTLELTSGARVTRVMAPGGVSFTSLPAELHFGLGAARPRRVEVRWPSGIVEAWALDDDDADRALELVEGDGDGA